MAIPASLLATIRGLALALKRSRFLSSSPRAADFWKFLAELANYLFISSVKANSKFSAPVERWQDRQVLLAKRWRPNPSNLETLAAVMSWTSKDSCSVAPFLFPFFGGCSTKHGPSPKKGSLFSRVTEQLSQRTLALGPSFYMFVHGPNKSGRNEDLPDIYFSRG